MNSRTDPPARLRRAALPAREGFFCVSLLGLVLVASCAQRPLPDLAADAARLRAPGASRDPASLRDLGWSELLLGHPAAAATALEAAHRAAPADVRALYGLALLRQERAEFAAARDLWLALLEAARTSRDPWAPALAESAAHRLLVQAGEPAGTVADEHAQALQVGALWQRARASLPPEAVQLLGAYAAQRLRLAGREDEARAIDAGRGCPAHFFAAARYGHLPRLDLDTPFAPDDPGRDPGRGRYRRVHASGCTLNLDPPAGPAGVMYAVTWARVERAARVPLAIESGGAPWALYADGRLRYREAAPRRRRLLWLDLAPGWHALSLKLPAAGARVQVQWSLPGARFYDGDPTQAPSPRTRPAPPAPLRALSPLPAAARAWEGAARDLLLAQQAYISGESDAGLAAIERARARAPRCPLLPPLQAALLAEDDSRPQRIVRDRVRRALDAALQLDPASLRARLELVQMALQEDHPDQALRLLDEAPAAAWPWERHLLRYRALRARGWLHEAEAALAAARAAGPAACAPLEALTDLRAERKDEAGARAAARDLAACNPYTDRYADALRNAGDLAAAQAEYQRLLRLDPENEGWSQSLLDVLLAQGEAARPAARALLGQLIARAPRNPGYRVKLANLLLATGDRTGAAAALQAGLAVVPESAELNRAMLALGGAGLLAPYRIDGREVIRQYEAHRVPAGQEDAAVIVLDRTVTRVFPSGARLTLTHNIMHVLTKDGIEKFGEVRVPEGAEVLTLRTVKADGGVREPEEIPEKDTVSAPDLEIGDYVEFEYIDKEPAPPAFPGGFLGERFYFASADAPLFRTEYVLVTPWAMPLQADRRGAPPEAVVEHRGDVRVTTCARQRVPRIYAEPPQDEGLASEWVPSVRPGSAVTFAGWRDYLRDRLSAGLHVNDELRRLAAEIGGAGPPRARALRLDAWVRGHIQQGGSLDEAATSVLASREGSRAVVLMALLRASGVPFELWLVRPVTAPRMDEAGALPHVEAYTEPLVVVSEGGGSPLYLDSQYRHAPGGLVRPGLRGGQALRVLHVASRGSGDLVGPPPPALLARVALPPDGAGGPFPDRREVAMNVHLQADGSGEVVVREVLRGWPAVEWREELERLPADKVRQELEQRSLGFFFPGASLEDLEYGPVAAAHDREPLIVRYRFHAPRLARLRQAGQGEGGGRELVLPAPYPALLSKHYVGVPVRHTPLMLRYVVPTVLEARVTPPRGAGAPRLAPDVDAAGFGHFVQRAALSGGDIVLHAELAMPTQRVAPAQYPDFVRHAGVVDAAEDAAAIIPLSAAVAAGPAAR